MVEVDGHAIMLSRLVSLYHTFRPTLPIETEKKFWANIANALERDFDIMPCKDVLNMATLLAEHHYLTPEMIVKIFNNKFIDKMTDYAKIPHYRENRLWFLWYGRLDMTTFPLRQFLFKKT